MSVLGPVVGIVVASTLAIAGPPGGPAAPVGSPAVAQPETTVPWIRRHLPQRHMVELGVAIGPFISPAQHGLIDEEILAESQGEFFQRYLGVAGAYDLRVGYTPFTWWGVEVEGGVAPTYTFELRERADLFAVRGQLVAQWPKWRVTPLVLAGAGLLGTRGALGTDVDPAGHFGLGGKVFVNDDLVLRVGFRDAVAAGTGISVAHYLHLSVAMTLSLRPRRARR